MISNNPPHNDLRDLFVRIGELDLEVWYLRKSLQAANEKIAQISEGLQVKKEEKVKDE